MSDELILGIVILVLLTYDMAVSHRTRSRLEELERQFNERRR